VFLILTFFVVIITHNFDVEQWMLNMHYMCVCLHVYVFVANVYPSLHTLTILLHCGFNSAVCRCHNCAQLFWNWTVNVVDTAYVPGAGILWTQYVNVKVTTYMCTCMSEFQARYGQNNARTIYGPIWKCVPVVCKMFSPYIRANFF